MRLDHIAYRTADRIKTAQFFIDVFGYSIQTEFEPIFPDGTSQGVKCIALEPPEKFKGEKLHEFSWMHTYECPGFKQEFHLAPEIFVSDGPPTSIVGKWVAERGGIGSIHHCAYQVNDVQKAMNEWKDKGYAEFASEEPFKCENLIQIFSKPSLVTGIIFELIQRDKYGFCAESVAKLMESSRDFK